MIPDHVDGDVSRVVLTSGKVYYALHAARTQLLVIPDPFFSRSSRAKPKDVVMDRQIGERRSGPWDANRIVQASRKLDRLPEPKFVDFGNVLATLATIQVCFFGHS